MYLFLYTVVRGCVQKVYNRYKLETVINFDIQFLQYNQKKHTKSIQNSRNALTGIKGCEKKYTTDNKGDL